jgi:hypothetical protein
VTDCNVDSWVIKLMTTTITNKCLFNFITLPFEYNHVNLNTIYQHLR